MDAASTLIFIALVALGSYIQTVSGFAIALVITGGVTALDLAPVAFTANVVAFVALANVGTAVHRRRSHIDMTIMLYGSLGVLLLSGVGLFLLDYLSDNAVQLLKMLLGVVILTSGAMLMIHPQPLKQVSSGTAHLVAGSLGGLLSGMFGAGGPPLVVHLYRQPLPFPIIRTTLLAILGIMPLIRLILEGFAGHITRDILWLAAISAPVSVLVTLFARRFPPPLSDNALRRFAFALLCVIGLTLIANNAVTG